VATAERGCAAVFIAAAAAMTVPAATPRLFGPVLVAFLVLEVQEQNVHCYKYH
jgi:hypothetical protein